MDCSSLFDRGNQTSPGCFGTSENRYAWLEHEKGKWHFLTNLFADPGESTRKWANQQLALDELTREGWTIVGSYPESRSRLSPSCGGTTGYGLIWMGP